MPLSEWDVLALDEKGRPSNGTSETSPAGVTVMPYEGVLQVASAECWHPLSNLPQPQFGLVRDGESLLLDVRLISETVKFPKAQGGATRGIVWATWFTRGAEVAATAGVTVRGFDAAGRYVGVTPADVLALKEVLARWVREGRAPRELADLATGNLLRFNQGDAFIARQTQCACSATPPGEAELPMLYHAQRREALEPHIVRRDAGAAPAPSPTQKKAAKSAKKPAKKLKPVKRAA